MATPEHELEKHQYPESKYRTLFNQAGDGIVLIDAKTEYIIDCNPKFEKQTGRSLRELKKKRIWEIRPPELMNIAKETFISLKKVEESKPVQLDIQRPDGTIIPIEFTSRELTIKGKHYFQSISHNITSRLKYEEELRKSERNLARAQAVAHVGSWYLDIQKDKLLWSDETCRIFGVTTETSLTYEKFLDFIHPDDREYVDKEWSAALKGKPYDIEHRILADGEIKWVREKAEVETDANGNAFQGIGTVQDITEHKRNERSLADQQQAIRELSTPVLPVKAQMLVLPLIGTLDTFRARQMTMQLLSSIREQRAKVAVLDVTGVAGMDSAVANHLIQTVQAASLLGAVVIITGISAENAQTLAQLGVDLEGLHTYIDLQSGIEAAERILAAGLERFEKTA